MFYNHVLIVIVIIISINIKRYLSRKLARGAEEEKKPNKEIYTKKRIKRVPNSVI